MLTRNKTIKRSMINSLARLLLFGGSVLRSESMLKAAEKYSPGQPGEIEQQAIKCYEIFEKELKNEIDERRKDTVDTRQRYLMDLMLEDILGYSSCPQDLTIEYQKELGEFVTDIYRSAVDKSLKKFEWYNNLKNDLGNTLRDRFGLSNQAEENAFTGEGSSKKSNRLNRYEISFLSDRNIDAGFRSSLRKGEFNISGYISQKENFDLFGIGFDGGKLEVGTNTLRVCLEKAISDRIFSRFSVGLDELKNPNLNLILTGKRKNGKWEVIVGCYNGSEKNSKNKDEVYAAVRGYIEF